MYAISTGVERRSRIWPHGHQTMDHLLTPRTGKPLSFLSTLSLSRCLCLHFSKPFYSSSFKSSSSSFFFVSFYFLPLSSPSSLYSFPIFFIPHFSHSDSFFYFVFAFPSSSSFFPSFLYSRFPLLASISSSAIHQFFLLVFLLFFLLNSHILYTNLLLFSFLSFPPSSPYFLIVLFLP